jgi:N-acetylneuraminic acid mutarotase
MATSRESHSATLLSSGKVLVAGGNDGMDISATAELYDPASGLWSATGRMSQGRYGHTATPLPSGKVLVAGGYTSGYIPTASAELYDPATGTWASVASMLRPSIGHRATLLPSGKVLVTGGLLGGGSPTTEVELYDPVTNAWTMGASMSMPRLGHSAVLLASGKVLVVGTGSGAAPSTTLAELYDPATGTWNSFSMLQAHETPVVALLKSGKVLVADVSGGGVRTAEVYDPVAGTWTSTGISSEVRSGARVVTLSSGKVLVAGGFFAGGSGSFSYLASAELYDPATGTWSSAGSMSVGRGSHTATLLPSGDVLFAGGSSGGGGIVSTVSSAELYLP